MKRLPTSPLESSEAKKTLRTSHSGESDHNAQEKLSDDPLKTPVSKDTGSSLLSKMGEELTLEKLFSLYTELEKRVKTLEQLVCVKDQELVSVRCKNADLQRRLAQADAMDASHTIVNVEAMAVSLGDKANSVTHNTPTPPQPPSSSVQGVTESPISAAPIDTSSHKMADLESYCRGKAEKLSNGLNNLCTVPKHATTLLLGDSLVHCINKSDFECGDSLRVRSVGGL